MRIWDTVYDSVQYLCPPSFSSQLHHPFASILLASPNGYPTTTSLDGASGRLPSSLGSPPSPPPLPSGRVIETSPPFFLTPQDLQLRRRVKGGWGGGIPGHWAIEELRPIRAPKPKELSNRFMVAMTQLCICIQRDASPVLTRHGPPPAA